MSKPKPTAFPGIYESNGKLLYRLKVPPKPPATKWKWKYRPSRFVVGQELEASKTLDSVKRALVAEKQMFPKKTGPVTMGDYAEEKFFPRRRVTMEDWKSDETRLKEHVLKAPVSSLKGQVELGTLPLRDILAGQLAEAFLAFRAKRKANDKPYAPKSIWNTYGVVRALFRDAIMDGLTAASPCVLTEVQLGENTDADSEWREGAVFERDEAELLISSPLIPFDRQVWYSLEFLAALRLGEDAALRWRHWDTKAEPLGSLLVAKSHNKEHTKTKRARKMPVHPVLAAILTEWKLHGWPLMMGRHPQPDDLIIPVSKPEPGKGKRLQLGTMRTEKYVSSRTMKDLATLGLRHRRGHDLRATLITLALIDGAKPFHLQTCTHTPKKAAAFDLYNRVPWEAKCEAVASLKVRRQAAERGELVQLRVAVGAAPLEESRVTRVLPLELTMRNESDIEVEAAGIEPASNRYTDIVPPQFITAAASNSNNVRQQNTKAATVRDGLSLSAGNTVTQALESALSDWRTTPDKERLREQLTALLASLGMQS